MECTGETVYFLWKGVFAQILDSSVIQVIEQLLFKTEKLPNKPRISKSKTAESGT